MVALQVGDPHPTKILPSGKPKTIAYPDVKYDFDGWAKAGEYLPAKFDLVTLKTPSGSKRGWHTGMGWDGLKVERDDDVIYWKKTKEEP